MTSHRRVNRFILRTAPWATFLQLPYQIPYFISCAEKKNGTKTSSTHSFIWHRENHFTRKSTFLRLHSWPPLVQLITRILRRRKMGSGLFGWLIDQRIPPDDLQK